ncbi:glycosyltransferase family 4 protein [Cerasicoccus arenae]|nr:glycosyltransferase family 4 protein [Cerasicoccus arenae]MBK1857040.1 glycosyltransferase family 4 protein [Cerasicoccus arenae]
MCAKLAFITDLDLQPSGGGSYAVSWHAYQQLKAHFDEIEPLVYKPSVPWGEQLWSRLQRKILRQPGRFAYFSPNTLNRNAEQVRQLDANCLDAVFFRSAARWSRCRPQRPYFVYLDVVFHTFFHNGLSINDFNQKDLRRIWAEEAQFLEGAETVFFESQWGLDRAREAYQLSGEHYVALGRGGVLPPPPSDVWDGHSLNLVTIAMNFEQKGGDILLNAFEQLVTQYPELHWTIVGGPPPNDRWRAFPQIEYVGKLSPDVPEELARFESIYANAFLIIHPTREDTNPLVLTEAATFGCPAISVRKFGIPELVMDGETGLLLDPPITPKDLVQKISYLIEQPEIYRAMRQQARDTAMQKSTWKVIGAQMADRIKMCLA